MELKKFEKNIKSQFGEDGVISEIFNRIGTKNKICVEFGAWDGIHFSNTWNLWSKEGWEALLIEGDEKKYKQLVTNTAAYNKVKPFCAYVTAEGEKSLDVIFNTVGLPLDIDLLSIDIDGDDYYILQGLKTYTPRLIVIEYNPTIPPQVELIQKKGEYFGSSALAMLKLAHQKNYSLVHVTDTNLFLLNNDDFNKLGIKEKTLEEMFVYNHLAYVVSSYDGQTLLAGTTPYAQFDSVRSKAIYPNILNPASINLEKVLIQKIKK
jgi:hypothetical protein